jgi:hypothetical protein
MLIRALQAAAGNFGVTGYAIDNSLRFNDNDSAYLSRTPATAGNRKTFTFSAWVKRGNIGTRQVPFASNNGTAGHTFEINSTNTLKIFDTGTGASVIVETTPVFRDVSGWYHIILVADTTQATASNRIKFYVNGTLITNYAVTTYPSLNADLEINNNIAHNIGNRPLESFYFDGYLAETNFIDGQALTADDFGQIDATTGEWSPKRYSGTYGTNGFYLPFDGNSNDDSGNGNNWTENNLASTDYMLDTPTNNFAVFNALSNTSILSEGNLKTTRVLTNTYYTSISNIGVSSGKWYAEAVLQNTTNRRFGITSRDNEGTLNTTLGSTGSWGYIGYAGQKQYNGGTKTNYGTSYNDGDILGVALDMDAGTVTFYRNGVSQGVAFSGISGTVYIGISIYGTSTAVQGFINYGTDSSFAGIKTRQGNTDANGIGDFYYAPPAGGYLALCTDNLPEPAIVQPETQFNVVTWTGDSTTNRAITGVGFQPDFVWIKRRNGADGHIINDSVRGIPNNIFPFSTLAENTTAYLSSFDSDGFTLDIVAQATNLSGGTYVAWCWKAGGTAVSNTDGSITSQVSANVDAGFSVVSFTSSAGGNTVGHGLSQKPDLVIQKRRDSASDWYFYYDFVDGSLDYLLLNSTAASGAWGGSAATSSVFYENWGVTANIIAYCFHSVEGFSKFGSYVGNGSSTNGPFVYTGGLNQRL